MANISFKDILLKENGSVVNEIEYSYEEVMQLIEAAHKRPQEPPKKYPSVLYDYLDEKNDALCEIIKELKEKYSLKGFMNTMSYSDIFNIMLENISVEEIQSDTDENETFQYDEEINFSY